MISIIIPVYNAEKYLRRCIDSILNQEILCDFEVLLINDGSSDGSIDICEEYAENFSNVKIFTQVNQGPSAARNHGIEKSVGEFITFVDSDDFVTDDYFKILEELFVKDNDLIVFGYKTKSSSSDWVFGDEKNIYFDRENILKLFRSTVNSSQILWYPWNKLYKKEIIDKHKIRFSEKIKIGEDTIFNLNYLFYCNNIYLLKHKLYNYIDNDTSLTQTKTYRGFLLNNMENHYSERVKIHNRSIQIQGEEYDRDIAKYYIEHIFLWLLNNAKKSENYLIELTRIRESIIYNKIFKNYKYNWKHPRKSVIIKLFQLKLLRLIYFFSPDNNINENP